jgi:hypothetical protein
VMRETTKFLRKFIGSQIRDVHDVPDGIAIGVGPPGRMSRREVVLIGTTEVVEVVVLPRHRAYEDDAQAQTDIGDDMYERQRYDEQDMDVEPGREDRRPRKESP